MEVEYDNGERERVLAENVSPQDLPLDFGGEDEPLQVCLQQGFERLKPSVLPVIKRLYTLRYPPVQLCLAICRQTCKASTTHQVVPEKLHHPRATSVYVAVWKQSELHRSGVCSSELPHSASQKRKSRGNCAPESVSNHFC